MKIYFTLIVALLISCGIFGQTSNPNYDADLAKHLGADDYGMKSYIFVILKTGSNTSTDKEFRDSCFAGHFKNMQKMTADKKLIVAGPMGKNDETYRGLFILDVTNPEEAASLLQNDPAIREGFLEPVLYEWYGSAALSEYLEAADKIWKVKP